jgi:hypothetical protein
VVAAPAPAPACLRGERAALRYDIRAGAPTPTGGGVGVGAPAAALPGEAATSGTPDAASSNLSILCFV